MWDIVAQGIGGPGFVKVCQLASELTAIAAVRLNELTIVKQRDSAVFD
jgi:hypothetical protein